MYVTQSIQRPHGINVFGSALLGVDPDYASIRFAVTRVMPKPKEAFATAREAAANVRMKVRELGVNDRDVRASDVSLEEAYEGYNQDRRMVGYRATVSFHAIVRDFAVVEALLVGVVDAGADRILSVHHKTSKLRELRRQARARAIESAKAKATEYATAAGAKIGTVLHIEDVNADDLSRRSHMPDVDLTAHDDSFAQGEVVNPGSIMIAAAAMVCFAIVP